MDKKQDKQHQNLSLHERYLALLDKHNAENADKPPEEQAGPQIKNEVVKKALAAVHGPGKLDSLAFLSDESLDKVLDELAELYDSDLAPDPGPCHYRGVQCHQPSAAEVDRPRSWRGSPVVGADGLKQAPCSPL